MFFTRDKEISVRQELTKNRRSGSLQQKSGLILIFIGFLCFLAAFFLWRYQESQKNILSFSRAPEPTVAVEEDDLPERIAIPKMGIDLSVSPARVVDNQWETFQEGVAYLLGSGVPGREGNVVIYGHNKNYLFGPIRWLEIGDEIEVINKKGEKFVYQVMETKTVSPETVEVLAPTDDASLTLYTCTGFLDKERFVVVGK